MAGESRVAASVLVAVLLAQVLWPSIGRAQTTSLTSSGLGTTVTQNGTTYDITGGTLKGSNLFHSFGQFSVGTGDTANFNNVSNSLSVTNILGRVTGGATSNIYGTIQTTGFGTANLFLINPAGWMFGPGASLNVGGSFYVSTANYIRLGDGVQFSAVPGAGDDLLTTAPPVAFGFLGPAVAPIAVEGTSLVVPEGKTLSLIGGDVSITGSTLQAPSGRIQIAGVASGGEVTIPDLDVSSFSSLGQITISADNGGSPSMLDTTGITILDPDFFNPIGGGAGGEIVIRGGRLAVTGSMIQTGGYGDLNGTTPKIDIAITDSVALDSSLLDASGRQTFDPDGNSTGGGAGGAVIIRAGSFTADNFSALQIVTYGNSDGATPGIDIATTGDVKLQGFSGITTGTFGGGRSGDVHVVATGDVQLLGGAGISTTTLGAGRGGDVHIAAANVTFTDSSGIASTTSGNGAGGDVEVSAADSLVITGGSNITTFALGESPGGRVILTSPSITVDGAGSVVRSTNGGISESAAGGDLTVNAGDLTLTGGGSLITDTGAFPPGNIVVTASGSVTISGDGSGIFSTVQQGFGNEHAGDISVAARQLTVTGNGAIKSGEFAAANAGSISITATDSIDISNGGKVQSFAVFADVGDVTIFAPSASLVMDHGLIQTSTTNQGNAGDINVNVASLSLTNGAQIVTSSEGTADGRGGNLSISAAKSVSISGSSSDPVSNLSNGTSSGLFSTASAASDAAALGGGNITVTTPMLTITDGAKVSALTPGAGPAGSISLDANSLSVASGGEVVSSTQSTGAAGSIAVTGSQVDISSGGRVVSESSATGNAGTVTIGATNAITVTDPGSAVSTTTFGDGAGGDVALSASQVNVLNGGRVTSESGGLLGGAVSVGTGNGGQVAISGGTITVSDHGSLVSTTTFGDGAGGSVTLTAAQVNIQNGGHVASQSGGTLGGALTVGSGSAGTVTINATGPDTLTISGPGSTVSTSTLGEGNGGDVLLSSAGDVRIQDGGSVTADSLGGAGRTGKINVTAGDSIIMDNGTISTRAVTSDGGDIKLTAPNIVQISGSQITTSVESGVGGGGNISIDPQFVLVNNSSIIANAFGGPGGNISIVAANFLSSATSVIDASSALSTPGVIEIRSPENNVESSIAQLPAAFIDASALLRGLCAARRTGAPNSFVVAGRGGIPVDADGYLPSFGIDVAAAVANAGDPARVGAGRIDPPALAVSLLLPNELDCAR